MEQTSFSKVFEYGSSSVRMRTVGNGNVQVCVTDFAKAFPNKNLSTIVNSQEIREYVKLMSEKINCKESDLLLVKHGGLPSEQGIWANLMVAIKIAGFLSTELSLRIDMYISGLIGNDFRFENFMQPFTKIDKRVYQTYIIYDNTSKLYKIGKSANLKKRMYTFSLANPNFNLVLVIDGDVEEKLHEEYAHKKEYAEWFRLNKNDIVDIRRKWVKDDGIITVRRRGRCRARTAAAV